MPQAQRLAVNLQAQRRIHIRAPEIRARREFHLAQAFNRDLISHMTLMSLLAAITTIAHASPTPFARPVPPQNPIRVRIAHTSTFNLSGVNLTINGRAYPGPKAIHIVNGRSDDGTAIETITGSDLRINLKPAPSQLALRKKSVVATLDLETYLQGVLPVEMPASWPLEALKAQAVAARTFALFRQSQSRAKDFDVDSDVMDQMFLANAATTQSAVQAINETRGLVLKTAGNKFVSAYFHSDCGGHTEDAKHVWGTNDSAGTAGCPFSARSNWVLKLTLKQLANKLRQPLKSFELGKRNDSGRIENVYLALNDGSGRTITANDFRQAIGYGELKSTAFTVSRVGETFTFAGRGFGHGVGLCQWGARQMAKQGSSFKEILAHYYPKANLDRHPNLDDEERDGANNKQAAQFHKRSLYSKL